MRQSKRVDGLPSDGPARRTRARYLSDDDPPLQTVVSAASPASETADPPLPSVAFQHDNFPPQPEAPQNIPDVPPQLTHAPAASATSPQLPPTPPGVHGVDVESQGGPDMSAQRMHTQSPQKGGVPDLGERGNQFGHWSLLRHWEARREWRACY